jgi:hypothetical protein
MKSIGTQNPCRLRFGVWYCTKERSTRRKKLVLSWHIVLKRQSSVPVAAIVLTALVIGPEQSCARSGAASHRKASIVRTPAAGERLAETSADQHGGRRTELETIDKAVNSTALPVS